MTDAPATERKSRVNVNGEWDAFAQSVYDRAVQSMVNAGYPEDFAVSEFIWRLYLNASDVYVPHPDYKREGYRAKHPDYVAVHVPGMTPPAPVIRYWKEMGIVGKDYQFLGVARGLRYRPQES